MIELIPDWILNIHPLIVHFPIAILLLAFIMDIIQSTSFLPKNWWNRRITTILYALGTVAAIAAYYTGTIAADTVFLPTEAQTILNNHADWALWTVWFFSIYTLIRIALHWLKEKEEKPIQIIMILLALPGVYFLFLTGDNGAKMVYGYGVGTGNLLAADEQSITVESESVTEKTDFKRKKDGAWIWEINNQSVSTLVSEFQWLEGSPLDVKPEILQTESKKILKLELSDSTQNAILFVEERSVQNVQVDYYIDISGFKGEISLVNHLVNSSNYDFVTLGKDKNISQGRITNEEKIIFAKETYSTTGLMFIRTVVNGTHFRAYINKEMAVHGHGEAPKKGRVGLKINGSGIILINKIEAIAL